MARSSHIKVTGCQCALLPVCSKDLVLVISISYLTFRDLRNKTMAVKFKCIPNDDTQNYFFYSVKLEIETSEQLINKPIKIQ